jgi:glycine cleavage system protein P-like pyridoxal-binding family
MIFLDCRGFLKPKALKFLILLRLMDYGYHAPASFISRSRNINDCSTESEDLGELDRFVDANDFYSIEKKFSTSSVEEPNNVPKKKCAAHFTYIVDLILIHNLYSRESSLPIRVCS